MSLAFLGDASGSALTGRLDHSGLPAPGRNWPLGVHFSALRGLEEARRVLGPTEAIHSRRREVHSRRQTPDEARSRLMLGQHDRGEEYVFLGGPIHQADLTALSIHFPAPLKIVRLPEFRLMRGQSWNVSASAADWLGSEFETRFQRADKFYTHICIDRLIVEPGSSLEVYGNLVVLECQEIELRHAAIKGGGNSTDGFEIRLRPSHHPPYSRQAKLRVTGRAGTDGGDGVHSPALAPAATIFGPYVPESAGERHGTAGGDGSDGERGTPGGNGGWQMLADIRIASLAGFDPASLRISAQAGTGRDGQPGGRGGNGGSGGNGADGLDGIFGFLPGGPGGAGGAGGRGGGGGDGGNGGLASNILIQIPATLECCLVLNSTDSVGGLGGVAGMGGMGGTGGAHGALALVPAGMGRAPAGARGQDGCPGRHGKSRPRAKFHVFVDP